MISSINLTKKIFAVTTFVIIMKSKQRILRSITSHALVGGIGGNLCVGCAMNLFLREKNVGKNTRSGI